MEVCVYGGTGVWRYECMEVRVYGGTGVCRYGCIRSSDQPLLYVWLLAGCGFVGVSEGGGC